MHIYTYTYLYLHLYLCLVNIYIESISISICRCIFIICTCIRQDVSNWKQEFCSNSMFRSTSVIHFTSSRVLLKEMMLRSCIPPYCSLVSASFANIRPSLHKTRHYTFSNVIAAMGNEFCAEMFTNSQNQFSTKGLYTSIHIHIITVRCVL